MLLQADWLILEKADWLILEKADWLILENDEKATLHYNVPFSVQSGRGA